MKKLTLRLMALMCLVSIASLVLAQTPGRQGQGGGQGQGQGQRQGGMQRMGGGGLMGVLNRADVQKDINLTAEQKTKLQALGQKMQEEMRAAMEAARDSGDPQGAREGMRTMQQAFDKEAEGILTADQLKRVKEIQIQLEGVRAVMNPEVQRALNLTAEQRSQLQAAQEEQRAKMQEMRQQMQQGGGAPDREAMQKMQQDMQKAMEAKINSILTQAQKDQLKAMGGKPFQADPNIRPGGRGPGGGGGR